MVVTRAWGAPLCELWYSTSGIRRWNTKVHTVPPLLRAVETTGICQPERVSFTDAELDAAVTALSDPGRLNAAQNLVSLSVWRPSLQKMPAGSALHDGGWFDTAHEAAITEAMSNR